MPSQYIGSIPVVSKIRDGSQPAIYDFVRIDINGNRIDPYGPPVIPMTINDGQSHKLSSYYSSLSEAQEDYPFVDTLDIELALVSAYAMILSGVSKDYLIPRGVYLFDHHLPISNPCGIYGSKFGTVIKRSGTIADNKGVIDIVSSGVSMSFITIDGNVTSPTGVNYSSIIGENSSSDPMHLTLTRNTSIWVHEGTGDHSFDNIVIQHTGGYALLLDARDGDINNVAVTNSIFRWNRPHLMGTSNDDLNYGSWTGGLHYQSDGRTPKLYGVNNLQVRGCTWIRNTGNCLWGHLYGFDRLHQNHRYTDNYFEDCGLDGICVGGVSGGSVRGNGFRRVGFVALTDDEPSVPRYLPGLNATALDTSGVVIGVNYLDNTIVTTNGGCIDLDGYSNGVVAGNTCRFPRATDPEYTEDGAASFNTDGVYGIQPSNSSQNVGGENVVIDGNVLINLRAGAIRLYASRGGVVINNKIDHPADAWAAPVLIGCIGPGSLQRSYRNFISNNQINWNPLSLTAAIQETGTNWNSGDENWVSGNRMTGNCFEFLKASDVVGNPLTQTSTRMSFGNFSATATPNRSETSLQREGYGVSACWRIYSEVGAVKTLVASVLDTGPVFNISANGDRYTGAVTTGGRTSLGFYDVVATGKLYGDAFMALTDGEYLAADANSLPDTVGIIKYVSASKKFQTSVAVSAGARVWVDLGGSPFLATDPHSWTATQTFQHATDATPVVIQASAVGQTADLTTWKTAAGVTAARIEDDGIVYIAGVAQGTAAISVGLGFINSKDGFYTESVASNAIQAPNGGVTAKYGVWTQDDVSASSTLACKIGAREIRFRHTAGDESNAGVIAYRQIGDAGCLNILGAGTSVRTVRIYDYLYLPGVTSQATLTIADGYVQSQQGFYSPGTADDAIQAKSGGCWTSKLIADNALYIKSRTDQSNPGAGYAGIGHKTGTTYKFWNPSGGAWVEVDIGALGGGVTSVNSMTGVITIAQGSGITISSLAGTVSVTNAGVTSLSQGTGVSISASTGAVTISIGQSVATDANPQFATLRLSSTADNAIDIYDSGSGSTCGGGIQCRAIAAFQAVANAISAEYGGIRASTDATYGGFYVGSTRVVNGSGHFVGPGIDVGNNGIKCRAVNPYLSGQYYGRDATLYDRDNNQMHFVGGILVTA